MNKSLFKRTLVVFTVAVGMLALTSLAFAGGSSESSGSAAKSVQLNFTYRITSPGHDAWIKWLVDTFNQQNAGQIHINYTGIPDNGYKPKIQTELQGGGAPDVFFSWEGGYAKGIVDSGFAANLDKYYAKYGWDTSLSAAANSIAVIEGHKYYLPYSMDGSFVWYRTDIFKKYNLQIPKTWTDLEHVAAVLKQNGIAPFLLANQQKWEAQFPWTAYFNNKYGTQAYQGLLTRKIPWTDPRVVATFAEMKKLVDNGFFLSGVNSMDFDSTAIQPFSQGKVAMWYQGSFILGKFLNSGHTKLTLPVSFFPFPQIGSTPPSIEIFAENAFMLNAHSKYQDQGAKFLNLVASKQGQEQMVKLDAPFPVNKSVTVSDLPPMIQRVGDVISGYTGSTWMHVDHALAPNVALPFLNSLSAVISGQMTPEAAAQATEQAAQAAMGPVQN